VSPFWESPAQCLEKPQTSLFLICALLTLKTLLREYRKVIVVIAQNGRAFVKNFLLASALQMTPLAEPTTMDCTSLALALPAQGDTLYRARVAARSPALSSKRSPSQAGLDSHALDDMAMDVGEEAAEPGQEATQQTLTAATHEAGSR
jgi:hypothetical protein